MSCDNKSSIAGIVAEFAHPGELISAAKRVREAGYKRFDCHSPFPIHGMDAAMGLRPSKLGWCVGACGFTGTCCALLMQWWMNAVDYKVIISGKPFFSFQAFVPVIFELTILFSAFCAVFGMFTFNLLPRLNHPLFTCPRFAKVTDDGFFLYIEAADPQFDAQKTKDFVEFIGGTQVQVITSEPCGKCS